MPTYTYKARDRQGELLTATIETENELSAAMSLRSLGYSVISIQKETQLEANLTDFWQKIRKTHQYELIFFSRQLSSLLKSGIAITVALSSIAEQTKNKLLKETINAVLKDIQTGVSFSEALAKHPDIFSDLFVSMIKVGETTGILDEVLERLTQLNMQELEVKARIKSAMTYPLILVTVAIIIVSFLLINIIPKFVVVFETYEAKLPLATQILLGISFLLRRLWLLVIAAVAIFIFWFRRYIKTEKGRYKFDFYLLRLPLFGQLYLKLIVARFSRTLGALVKSGVSILEALSVTEKTVGNSVISRVIDNIRSAITEGQSLTEPFKASGVFPATVIQMVSLGEKSGKLDQMLIEVANFYDREVDYTVRNITTALEPLLLLAMGAMVAFIAL
ncbi:MAG: type II secretion system F family protein, partial [Candidatus Omnitrophica bacterium]|nr:type II secretion system F family protein [Candidatus Omnitrophota bacterium]